MKILRLCLAAAALLGPLACGQSKSERHATGAADTLAQMRDTLVIGQGSAGEELIRGFGFVMPVPVGTTLERKAESGTVYYVIAGPKRPTPSRTPDQGPSEPEPIFEISVLLVGQAPVASLDSFVDSLRRADNKTADSELGQTEPATVDRVGDRRALLLEPPCGDCAAEDRYVAGRRNVVLFRSAYGIHLAGTPAEQRPILRRILDGVQWK